jgi:hypothetical protein
LHAWHILQAEHEGDIYGIEQYHPVGKEESELVIILVAAKNHLI